MTNTNLLFKIKLMADTVSLKKDEFLFEVGDLADAMYIVAVGEISLIISDVVSEKIIAHAIKGQLLGEMSLFDGRTRSASAKAVSDTVLIRLSYKKLKEDLSKMPEWVPATLKSLSEKIRDANMKVLNL